MRFLANNAAILIYVHLLLHNCSIVGARSRPTIAWLCSRRLPAIVVRVVGRLCVTRCHLPAVWKIDLSCVSIVIILLYGAGCFYGRALVGLDLSAELAAAPARLRGSICATVLSRRD